MVPYLLFGPVGFGEVIDVIPRLRPWSRQVTLSANQEVLF